MSAEDLSDKELAVARLLARGRTKSEVAESLGLSASQVNALRAAALQKPSLRSRAELVRVAKSVAGSNPNETDRLSSRILFVRCTP